MPMLAQYCRLLYLWVSSAISVDRDSFDGIFRVNILLPIYASTFVSPGFEELFMSATGESMTNMAADFVLGDDMFALNNCRRYNTTKIQFLIWCVPISKFTFSNFSSLKWRNNMPHADHRRRTENSILVMHLLA